MKVNLGAFLCMIWRTASCGFAVLLAERLCLSELEKGFRGYAAQAEPLRTKAADGKPEAFRKDSGKAAP
jgi:hypothetical protein